MFIFSYDVAVNRYSIFLQYDRFMFPFINNPIIIGIKRILEIKLGLSEQNHLI